jgi:hypothetical protein
MPPTPDLSASDEDRTFEALLASKVLEAMSGLEVPVATEEDGPGTARRFTVRRAGAGKGTKRSQKLTYLIVHADGDHVYAVMQEKGKAVPQATAAERLRAAIRGAVKGTMGGRVATEDDSAVWRIAKVVERALPQARRKVSEATIEKMVDALVEAQDPMAPLNAEIDAVNAQARVRFMSNFLTLSAAEVTAQSGSTAKNRHQTPSRWKAEGKIFSVPWQGKERFPAFQFKEGRPLPVIAAILAALPSRMSQWEVAFWLVSTNSWLDGASPRECLNEQDRVVEAARLEGEAVVG